MDNQIAQPEILPRLLLIILGLILLILFGADAFYLGQKAQLINNQPVPTASVITLVNAVVAPTALPNCVAPAVLITKPKAPFKVEAN